MLKYHVAVCDDEKSDLDGIVQSVQRYDVQGCFDIETYMDGNELLSELQMQKKSFDLLLLDIEMPSNGFQLAQSLIQMEKHPLVVFVTKRHEYAVQGYGIAFRYLVKPLDQTLFAAAMDAVLQELNSKHFTIEYDGVTMSLETSDIYFLESHGHKVLIHCKEQDLTLRMSIPEALEQLPKRCFVSPHKSYLVNASRLFSCLYGQPLAVGRVMTPVLAMTVVREAAIAAFTPEKFYTVALTLADGGTASSKRFAQKADAELLLSKCRKEGRATVQKMERKEKSESPPQLYDLTALQRDANRLLGFTAQQTLDYAQSLYEKRLITYPRTDSRFLTEDMAASLPGLVTDTGKAFAVEEPLSIHVQQVINGSKVTDHHALLPTKSMANADLAALPAGERNVLRLIAARLLCAVGEPHRYAETSIITICAGEEFSAKGKLVLSDGWKAMERKMLGELLGKQKEAVVLPDAQEQSQCSVAGAELKEGQTTPPKHFTEDLLLHAMETASADSMPEGVERQGIGTPATRAATIEKLVQKGFLERKGNKKTKVLLPTDKGKALVTVMPEEIQSPEMTADWETKLLQIERSEMEPETFMTEIKEMISSLVTTTEAAKGANALMKNKIIGVCPNCGANVVEREKGWFCENRECHFVLWKDNAFFKRLGKRLDAHVADKLLRDGRVRLKDCKSAKGKTYNATVLLSCEADGRSKFSLEFEGGC